MTEHVEDVVDLSIGKKGGKSVTASGRKKNTKKPPGPDAAMALEEEFYSILQSQMGSGTSRHQRANNTTGDKTGEEVAGKCSISLSRVHENNYFKLNMIRIGVCSWRYANPHSVLDGYLSRILIRDPSYVDYDKFHGPAAGNVSRVHDDDVDHVEKEGDVSHDIRVNKTTEGAIGKNAMHSVTTSMQFRSTPSIRQPVPVEEIYQSVSTDDDDNGHQRSQQRSRSPVNARGVSKGNRVPNYLQVSASGMPVCRDDRV